MLKNPLFAYDFDGVLCDSARETAIAGWQTARIIWPDTPEMTAESENAFCQVRPFLHTGWQSALYMRLLLTGTPWKAIAEDTSGHLTAELLTRSNLSQEELIDRFATTRDRWLSAAPMEWLHQHRLYPGLGERLVRLSHQHDPIIITTKQHRFTCELLKYFGIEIAPERVFGLESGRKATVLQRLRTTHPQRTIVFTEDRLATLLESDIAADDMIYRIFAEWGYCTPADIEHARTHPSIESHTLSCHLNFLDSCSSSA